MNKIKHMKSIISLSIIVFSICVGSSPVLAEAVPQIEIPRSESSLAMQEYLESDPDLMALMEKSIEKAHEVNPDPNTNPVDNVEEFYDFLDWATTCLPSDVLEDELFKHSRETLWLYIKDNPDGNVLDYFETEEEKLASEELARRESEDGNR